MVLAAGCLLAAAQPSLGAGSDPVSTGVPAPVASGRLLLTNAAQVLALSPKQAEAAIPVRIRGVVTCYDHGLVLFVQDETAGVFVHYKGDRLPVQAGRYVQVSGFTGPGRYSPIVDSPDVVSLQTGPPVTPRPVSLADVGRGGLDSQWIVLAGVVGSERVIDNRLRLELTDLPHHVSVWIPRYAGFEQRRLVGSTVRVRGVVGISVGSQGQPDALQIFANSLADLTVLQLAPADPFAIPLSLIRDTRSHLVRWSSTGPVRVQGVVTFYSPDHGLFVQDATGGVEVHLRAPVEGVTPGTLVEVVGYLGPVLEAPFLANAVVRPLRNAPLPEALRLAHGQLLDPTFVNQLVALEAVFLGRAGSEPGGCCLAFSGGKRLVLAALDASALTAGLPKLSPGTPVALTGVYQRPAEITGTPLVRLLLRSPADLRVLGRPPATGPWLHTLAATAILVGAALGLALWLLHKQRRRTEHVLELQATLQAEMRQNEQQLRHALQERERIGRDLHDDIIQSIYSVGLSLEGCRRVVFQAPEQAEARLTAAIHALNQTIRSVRGFIAGLEPKVLSGSEFKTALKSLALTSASGSTQVQIDVDASAAKSLTSVQATQLRHIAKEAMSNSLRHAQAQMLHVSLRHVNEGIRLEVRDDGIGFDLATRRNTGEGLGNLTARARDLGAELRIISASQQGCAIVVTVLQPCASEPN